jgi:hypothetical protein
MENDLTFKIEEIVRDYYSNRNLVELTVLFSNKFIVLNNELPLIFEYKSEKYIFFYNQFDSISHIEYKSFNNIITIDDKNVESVSYIKIFINENEIYSNEYSI